MQCNAPEIRVTNSKSKATVNTLRESQNAIKPLYQQEQLLSKFPLDAYLSALNTKANWLEWICHCRFKIHILSPISSPEDPGKDIFMYRLWGFILSLQIFTWKHFKHLKHQVSTNSQKLKNRGSNEIAFFSL